jgi:hypothetical protein
VLELDYPEHIAAIETALAQLRNGKGQVPRPLRHPV